MLRYLETFYRHRPLLLAPLVLAVIVGVGVVMMQGRTYEATSKLWIDRAYLGQQNAENAYVTPADSQSAVLAEMLKTRSFCVKVGRESSLDADLASPKASGSNPVASLLGKVRGGGGGAPPTQDQVDDMAFQLVSKATVTAVGPNVITVGFTYPKATVAADTTREIVSEFLTQVLAGQQAEAKAAVDFYQQQVKDAQSALDAADSKVSAYVAAHPEQRLSNAAPDATLTQLKTDDDLARQRYQDLLQKLDQAKLQGALSGQSAPNGFRVVDEAQVPNRPVSVMKTVLTAGGASVVGGLVLMLLCLVGLTATDTSIRYPGEVQSQLGLRVVGVVPRLGS